MTALTTFPRLAAFAAGIALTASTGLAQIESFWNEGGGGFFDDPLNWNGPVPDATVTAIFDIVPIGPEIAVRFEEDEIADRLIFRTTVVNLDLWDQDKSLEQRMVSSVNAALLTPSVVVGEGAGDVAIVIVEAGSLQAPILIIGQGGGSSGAVTFRLNQNLVPSLTADLVMHVGQGGEGTLVIDQGTEVTTFTGIVGALAGSYGLVQVADPGSQLVCGGALTVGKLGEGVMEIGNQADVFSAAGFVGQQSGGIGIVTVDGGGARWDIAGLLDVGQEGQGTLNVAGGGQTFVEGNMTIGTFPEPTFPPKNGGVGDVTVSGPASLLVVQGDLYVGFQWMGTLQVLDHAVVTSQSGSIGFVFGNGLGFAKVAGGSIWSVAGGASVRGSLEVSDDGLFVSDTLWVREMSELVGDGTVLAELTVDGALRPGAPVGAMTIDGGLELGAMSQTVIEIAGAGDYDSVHVTSTALLQGSLDVELVDGFEPSAGDMFQVLGADGGVNGQFTTLNLPALPKPLFWQVAYGASGVMLAVGPVPADIDGDGTVGTSDLLELLASWGPCDDCESCPADIDGDCAVGANDLLLLLAFWG